MQQSVDGTAFAELLAFVAVAEDLSFTRAGVRLGRDATVVSRRVRALEARLGIRLLERTTRSVAVTEAGRTYLARAREVLRALEEAEESAQGFASGEPRGHLRLALPGSFGRLWIAPALVDFLAAYPRVTVEAEFSNRFVDLIGENFDLAVRLGTLTDSRLVARRIGSRGRLLCAAPAHLDRYGAPRHPRELAERPCLIFAGVPSGPRWELRRDGEVVRIPVSGPLMSDDPETLLTAAVAGLGTMIATEWLVGRDLAAGRLVRVLPDWSVTDEGAIYVVTASGTHRASKTHAFSDFLAARFRVPPWTRASP